MQRAVQRSRAGAEEPSRCSGRHKGAEPGAAGAGAQRSRAGAAGGTEEPSRCRRRHEGAEPVQRARVRRGGEPSARGETGRPCSATRETTAFRFSRKTEVLCTILKDFPPIISFAICPPRAAAARTASMRGGGALLLAAVRRRRRPCARFLCRGGSGGGGVGGEGGAGVPALTRGVGAGETAVLSAGLPRAPREPRRRAARVGGRAWQNGAARHRHRRRQWPRQRGWPRRRRLRRLPRQL